MKAIQKKLTDYLALDEKLEQEALKYDNKLETIWDQRNIEIIKLRGDLIDYFNLFEMLPYFSEEGQRYFKKYGFVYTDITERIDNYEIQLCLKMDCDSVYVELNDVRIFDCLMDDIISQEEEFRKVPGKVRNALEVSK